MPQHLSLVSTTGQPHPLRVPTSWADLTLSDYIRWLRHPQEPSICVFCGLSEATLHQLAAADAAYLLHCLAFLEDESPLTGALPPPELADIGQASYGQLLLVQQFLDENPDQPFLFYAPYVYAVYESERRYGKDNSSAKLQQLYQDTLTAPLPEVYAPVVFTMGAWRHFTSATPPPPKTTPSPTTTNTRPASKSWATALARFFPWIRWRAETCSSTGTSLP
jgi:hypothetical protein